MPNVDTASKILITLQVDRCVGVNYHTENELICGACVYDVILWGSSRPDHRIR